DAQLPENQLQRGRLLINLATLWQAAQRAKAEETYRSTADLFEELVKDFPQTADYRHALALCYNNLSRLLATDRSRAADAAEVRAKALTHLRKLVEQHRPDDDPAQYADARFSLGKLLIDEARYLWTKGSREEAVDLEEQAAQQLAD